MGFLGISLNIWNMVSEKGMATDCGPPAPTSKISVDESSSSNGKSLPIQYFLINYFNLHIKVFRGN